MRLVQTPTAWVEEYDSTVCTGCGGPLALGRYRASYLRCGCVEGEQGHRLLTCRACGTVHYEPAHNPHYGPSADYGGRTTHFG